MSMIAYVIANIFKHTWEKILHTTLVIQPIGPKSVGEKCISLSDDLNRALQNRIGKKIFLQVCKEDLPYFLGLYDEGIKDAKVVVDLISKFGDCILIEKFY